MIPPFACGALHDGKVFATPAQQDVDSILQATIADMKLFATSRRAKKATAEELTGLLRYQAETYIQEHVPRMLTHASVIFDVTQALVDLACQEWANQVQAELRARRQQPGLRLSLVPATPAPLSGHTS